MAYVVSAIYRTLEGEEEHVASILRTMGPLSRSEPACLHYQAHRSSEDPRIFFLYEQYADEAGYFAHQKTDHFKQHILGDAIPRLERRDRAFYTTLDEQ
jgi:quinol monooxygenase YgiN